MPKQDKRGLTGLDRAGPVMTIPARRTWVEMPNFKIPQAFSVSQFTLEAGRF